MIQQAFENDFSALLADGNSRSIYDTHNGFIGNVYKDQIHAEGMAPLYVAGIGEERAKISSLLFQYLHERGVKTSFVKKIDSGILEKKARFCTHIETIVKTNLRGAPKYNYKNLIGATDRFGNIVSERKKIEPSIRFDWRNPLPDCDFTLPKYIADMFLNVECAEATAIAAFKILSDLFADNDLDLPDACFYVNKDGDTICCELSPDNMSRIEYIGSDEFHLQTINHNDKNRYLSKYSAIYEILRKKTQKR